MCLRIVVVGVFLYRGEKILQNIISYNNKYNDHLVNGRCYDFMNGRLWYTVIHPKVGQEYHEVENS